MKGTVHIASPLFHRGYECRIDGARDTPLRVGRFTARNNNVSSEISEMSDAERIIAIGGMECLIQDRRHWRLPM
jgi:hypothetical protein